MVDQVIVNNTKLAAAGIVEAVYTSPSTGAGTVITAFTASNSFTASVSYKAYIYDSSGTGDPVVPLKIIVKDRFDSAPGLIGQVIPAGGTLRLENSTANSLSFFATGLPQ